MGEHARSCRGDYSRDQCPHIYNVDRDHHEEEWEKRLEGESHLDYSKSQNNPRHKRQHRKDRAHHQRLHIQRLRKRHRPPRIPVLKTRKHIPPGPSYPLLEQSPNPSTHLLPTLHRRQPRSNVSPSKPDRQLCILNQRLRIPQTNLLYRNASEERVRPGKCNEQSQRVLSIIRQAIQEILVRNQPRDDALPEIQRPMKAMHGPGLRTVEISKRLLHSLLFWHVVRIKRRNDLTR